MLAMFRIAFIQVAHVKYADMHFAHLLTDGERTLPIMLIDTVVDKMYFKVIDYSL